MSDIDKEGQKTGGESGNFGKIDAKLLEILACPLTKTPLRYDAAAGELISDKALLAFPVRDGIPIMLVEEAREIDKSESL